MSASIRVKLFGPNLRGVILTQLPRIYRQYSPCQRMTSVTTSCTTDVKTSSPYFITTPIFYVNAVPHIGHLYTVVLADTAAIWQRLKGRQTLFSVGTDEHGLKIQQAANAHGESAQHYCDRVSLQFKLLFDKSGISYDDFIRTTETRHYRAVQTFWETLNKRGYIYKSHYQGWYSVSDEAFLTDQEVQDCTSPDGKVTKVSIANGQPVTWMREENYLFRLSAFREQLTSWLDTRAIKPSHFEGLVRCWLDDLQDLSVSRQRERLSWGIPVPGDDSQTVYVWLDALVNYLTVAGYPDNTDMMCWPPACHVIGKDILRFHAVYWPAFLFAAGLQPPSSILCHSHWLVDGHKMSKSRGNVVDPMNRIDKYSVDGLRYFLLKESSFSSDGNYSDSRAIERINSDLVNTLGNLLNRVTAPSINKHQEFPPLDENLDLLSFVSQTDVDMYYSLYQLPDQVSELYDDFAFSRAIDILLIHIYWTNSLVQAHQPWKLVKSNDATSQQHLQLILHVSMETMRVCGILLQPVIPYLASSLLTRLGISPMLRGVQHVSKDRLKIGRPLKDKITLLKRIQSEQ